MPKVGHGPQREQGFFQKLLRRGASQPAVREVKAVRGITFSAKHGEAIGIIGVNGSGKSTLLRAIAGLIPPASGTVHVASSPALLGVNAVLMKDLTGERNIMIGALALGLTTKEVRRALPGDRGLRGSRRLREPADEGLLLRYGGATALRDLRLCQSRTSS